MLYNTYERGWLKDPTQEEVEEVLREAYENRQHCLQLYCSLSTGVRRFDKSNAKASFKRSGMINGMTHQLSAVTILMAPLLRVYMRINHTVPKK